ncbi:helix-turn-helix transcriptional regulator [Paenibacillus sp. UNC499MF]|uniref:helix-turn-helix transcriptional regulator n=1 Tax=Paenibacillus sp. UNC499MF TaxID=1502751 RepID=UPI0008A091FA|nr:LuxR C-terminal-related transcriptional regulator [Paenibacillus sp. UNC499MF]SEF83988.1 regulatory protein, luxR family [Paenibacillus sp. UNC499MF]
MSHIFHSPLTVPMKFKSYAAINEEYKADWVKELHELKINTNKEKLTIVNDFHSIFLNNRDTAVLIEKEIISIREYLPYSHLFLFTDINAVALNVWGDPYSIESAKTLDLIPGASLSFSNTGINAVSIAMKLNEMVILNGNEHDLEMFKKWTSICSPIRQNENTIGYLNLSFALFEQNLWAIPVLAQIAVQVERKIFKNSPHFEKKLVVQFINSGFSKRESEVACLWLQNYSVLKISVLLDVSEGTVKNVIQKIYKKTGIRNKAEFLLKYHLTSPQ